MWGIICPLLGDLRDMIKRYVDVWLVGKWNWWLWIYLDNFHETLSNMFIFDLSWLLNRKSVGRYLWVVEIKTKRVNMLPLLCLWHVLVAIVDFGHINCFKTWFPSRYCENLNYRYKSFLLMIISLKVPIERHGETSWLWFDFIG